jgi:peptidase A4-like protein
VWFGTGPWSGVVDSYTNLYGQNLDSFLLSYTQFTVPKTYAETCKLFRICYTDLANWAGIGGVNGTVLWQAGAEEWTTTVTLGQTSGYDTWFEVVPNMSTSQSLFSVNSGDEVEAEVWICLSNGSIVQPNSAGARLCFSVYDVKSNASASGYLSYYACSAISGVTNACSGNAWPGSFQTAEAINEWPTPHSQFDFGKTDPFTMFGEDQDEFGNFGVGMNGPSSLDPFSTQTWNIGSPGNPIGTACVSTATPLACTDSGSYVSYQWHQWN